MAIAYPVHDDSDKHANLHSLELESSLMYPLRRQDGSVTSHPSGLHHPFPTYVKSDPYIGNLNQNCLGEIFVL